MSKVSMREQCPECHSQGFDKKRNNKVTYTDGSSYCFRCRIHWKKDEIDENLEIKIGIVGRPDVPLIAKSTSHQFIQGDYVDLPSRGITKKTCEFYRYHCSKNMQVANYYDSLGKLQKQKIRYPDKAFSNVGNTTYLGLCGMDLFKPSKKLYVTITEGELDMLSIAQVYDCKYAVVSLPNGWGDIVKVIAFNLDWLLGWKHVVFALDNDEKGLEATELGIDALSDTAVHVVRWPERVKDANDMLRDGKEKELRNLITRAVPVIPDCIINLGTIIHEALEPVVPGYSWGWKTLDAWTFGMRMREFIMLGGGVSVGKTTFINQIYTKLIFDHHEKIGIISFEQSPNELVTRLVGQIMGQRIWRPDVVYDRQKALDCEDIIRDNAYCIDTSKGLNTVQKVFSNIRYLIKALGIKYIFLDHMTAITSMIQGDERQGIDWIMVALQKMVKELDCFLMLLCHFKRPNMYQSKDPNTSLDFEQGRKPKTTDFRGSSSLGYYPDSIFVQYRDTFQPFTPVTVEVFKNRVDSDIIGSKFQLEFSRDTGKLQEIPEII